MASASTQPSRSAALSASSSSTRTRKASSNRPPLSAGGGAGGQSSSSSSTAAGGSSSAYHPSTRRHSLFGTDDRVVLDLGARVWKVGFSGEPRPRAVFGALGAATPPYAREQQASSAASGGQGAEDPSVMEDGLWDLNFGLARGEADRKEKEALLLARLTHMLRNVFFQQLMVDPKQRKVIVLENAYTPDIVKKTICRVLFGNLQVPSVSFVPVHLLSLVATGRLTGLVLDCGHLETSVLPVFYARTLSTLVRTTPRAGQRLSRRLRALLLHYGQYFSPVPSFQGAHVPSGERMRSVPPELLTPDFLDEIKARALFVSEPISLRDSELDEGGGLADLLGTPAAVPPTPGQTSDSPSRAVAAPVSESEDVRMSDIGEGASISDEAADGELMRQLKRRYAASSTATDLAIRVPPAKEATSASGNGPGNAPSTGRGAIAIPGWVRERAAEVLFEEGDIDEASIVELVLDALKSLPVDIRKPMASNILVTGGTAMLPGFVSRLRAEVVRALDGEGEESEAPTATPRPRQQPLPSDPPQTPRPASSSRSTARIDAPGTGPSSSALQPTRSSFAPGWSSLSHLAPYIAILNDPSPPPPPTSSSQTAPPHQAGSAPALSANMLAWVGGSLAGSLKTGAIGEQSREAWDENEALFASADRIAGREGQRERERERDAATATTRPGWGASHRGSLVGVVGGLETGTFGALEATQRLLSQAREREREAIRQGAGGSGGGNSGAGGGTAKPRSPPAS